MCVRTVRPGPRKLSRTMPDNCARIVQAGAKRLLGRCRVVVSGERIGAVFVRSVKLIMICRASWTTRDDVRAGARTEAAIPTVRRLAVDHVLIAVLPTTNPIWFDLIAVTRRPPATSSFGPGIARSASNVREHGLRRRLCLRQRGALYASLRWGQRSAGLHTRVS